MTAVDFMVSCVGVGVLSVCVAWSAKLLTDVRARVKASTDRQDTHTTQDDVTLDPMNQRLLEFRRSRFGVPVVQDSTRPPPVTLGARAKGRNVLPRVQQPTGKK